VLARALRSSEASSRARAALAIGRLQDSAGTALLLPLLADREADVRREAVFALGQIGLAAQQRPAPARAALERVAAAGDPATLDLALEALGKLGDRASAALVASYLRHEDPAIRGTAAVALWRLADSTVLAPLIDQVEDPDPGVRWRVLYALEKIPAPDPIVLIAALHVDDADPLVRAYAVRTIGRQKSTQGTAYVQQKLADPDVGVTVNAIRALQLIADTTCGTCLDGLTRALGAAHPYVRVTAASALADRFAWAVADSAEARAALDSLRSHLRDPDAATRGACAGALMQRRGGAAADAVRPMLRDSSAYARAAALRALARLPATEAVPLLTDHLRASGPPSTPIERTTAAEALGTIRSPAADAVLKDALADSSGLVVGAAAGALAEAGDSSAVPLLVRAFPLWVQDADARSSIRDALRSLGAAREADSLNRAHPARPAGPRYDAAFFAPPDARGAVLHTAQGDIEWAFYGSDAPQTVKNFVRLAASGYFDGLVFHRVVPNFVVQDGDPTGTGSGGPGYTIRCEYNRLRYDPGMVGMALSGKDTGGSQWFINHSPQPHLNGRYTIFARVVRGMDVVNRIVLGDRIDRVEVLR
jgi:cyclophilin family peptidyl-prolyl cis-trans isomerase/HEAT repeat protein